VELSITLQNGFHVNTNALAEIIQTADNPPEHATRITAMHHQDLILETLVASEKLWDKLRFSHPAF
jgi:hypothetical protein